MKVQGACDPAALGAARLSARTNLIVWPRAGIGILAVRRTRRFKRSIRRYYEPHGGAVRSGTERSLVRLETSRRFQTNVDERHVVKRDVINAPRPANIRDHRVSEGHRKLARWQSGPAGFLYYEYQWICTVDGR